MTPSPQLLADMERREGFRADPYQDSEGNWTRGIGEHDGIDEFSAPVTHAQAIGNLVSRLIVADQDARSLFGTPYDTFDDVRRDALLDLDFNMGRANLSAFAPFIEFMRTQDYNSAAYHLLVSTKGTLQSYTKQVGKRAIEIALRIATGTILPEHLI